MKNTIIIGFCFIMAVSGCAGNQKTVSIDHVKGQAQAAAAYYGAVESRDAKEVEKIKAAADAKRAGADNVSIRVKTSGTGDIAAPAGFQFAPATVIEIEATTYSNKENSGDKPAPGKKEGGGGDKQAEDKVDTAGAAGAAAAPTAESAQSAKPVDNKADSPEPKPINGQCRAGGNGDCDIPHAVAPAATGNGKRTGGTDTLPGLDLREKD
jgi:hypothetical protein